MITLQEFESLFREVSLAHILVNTYSTGEEADIAQKGNDIYPLVHLDQPFSYNVVQGQETNNIRFYVLDLQRDKDKTKVIETMSACKQIGQEIITYLRLKYQTDFRIVPDYTITTFDQFADDSTTGALFELQLITNVTVCNLDNLFDFGN